MGWRERGLAYLVESADLVVSTAVSRFLAINEGSTLQLGTPVHIKYFPVHVDLNLPDPTFSLLNEHAEHWEKLSGNPTGLVPFRAEAR
jgi:hypothetical protein